MPAALEPSQKRRRPRRIVLGLLMLVIGWFGWTAYSIWHFGSQDFAQSADCAIVLGAAAYGAEPSPVFEERIKHAVELYRRGVVRKLVFTGGFGEGATHAESEVGAQYATGFGVPREAILTETRSRTTRQNLAEAKAVMDAAELNSAVIVSDPLHLKRAALMAEHIGIRAVTSPTPTSRYRSTGSQLRFLVREIYFLHHYRLSGQ
jgi:uncharacterized SAM-binding protein YcdF (DUF218 family)